VWVVRALVVLLLLLAVGVVGWKRFTAPSREPVDLPSRPPPRPPFDVEHDEVRLDPSVARRVWEIEKVVHRVQVEAVPKLIEAWDGDAFPPFFADGFTAEVPRTRRTVRHGAVTIEHGDADDLRAFDASSWLAYLKEQGDPPRNGPALVAFHVDLLAPKPDGDGWEGTWTVRLTGPNTDYKAEVAVDYGPLGEQPAEERGWIRSVRTLSETLTRVPAPLLRDVTAGTGIATDELSDTWRARSGTTFNPTYALDYDGDGRLDLLVLDRVGPHDRTGPGRRCFLYRNRGDETFRDRTLAAGLAAPPRRRFFRVAVVGDFDDDGDDDLLFELGPQPFGAPVAYRNDGGVFRKTALTMPAVPLGNACVADFDGDRVLDLYLPNSGEPVEDRNEKARWIGDRTGPEGLLLRGRGGFRFEDVTAASNARGGNREVLGAQAVDLEPDGDADLVLANHMGENAVLVNDGRGTFEERPFAHPFGGFSMGLATGDFDGDLDPDLFVANMSSRAGLRIMSNIGAESYPPGVFPRLLGWIDGNEILRNDLSGFQLVGRDTAGWAYGPATVDLDGDGRVDVYCPVGYQSVDPDGPDG